MIKFFNVNDDKYFYLDSLEYAGKKMFLSEIEVVEFRSILLLEVNRLLC